MPDRGFTGGNLSWSGEASPGCHSRALGVKTGFLIDVAATDSKGSLGQVSFSPGAVLYLQCS